LRHRASSGAMRPVGMYRCPSGTDLEDAAAHLRVRDRPVAGDDATDLIAGSGPSGRGEREERREQGAEGDRPNDEECEGPRIPPGRARHRTTFAG